MENNTLFVNKYKPIYFNDFCIDNETILILKAFIAMDNLNIMLIGNISSGKTSLLNAIIKEYYLGYMPKDYKDNVLFINSLKEQGINYYRNDVKTFCQTCSNIPNRKKIIVLDDLDLINEQSQQVFRNCVDKYSHNVYFISSCYNKQKIIESLQSRFTIVKINSIQKSTLTHVFNLIKNEENIDIDFLAEDFIINISNNTIKILINYMEKFKLFGKQITFELANKLCTNISFLILEEYTCLVKNKDLKAAIKIIYDIFDKGYSVMDILDNYFLFIKNTTILTENNKYQIISVICKYISIFHNIHEDEIELALFTNNLITSIQ
jgi:DNA polymerase III delta prime subunit